MSKPYSELRNKMTEGQRKRVKTKIETLKKEMALQEIRQALWPTGLTGISVA